MNVGGRPIHDDYDRLEFTPVKHQDKYFAKCLICNIIIKNTGRKRLNAHRRKCRSAKLEDTSVDNLERDSKNPALHNRPDTPEYKLTSPLSVKHSDLGLAFKEHLPAMNPDFVFWTNPNTLVNRLRLLIASRDAGNNSHDKEIEEIIQELKARKIIA